MPYSPNSQPVAYISFRLKVKRFGVKGLESRAYSLGLKVRDSALGRVFSSGLGVSELTEEPLQQVHLLQQKRHCRDCVC